MKFLEVRGILFNADMVRCVEGIQVNDYQWAVKFHSITGAWNDILCDTKAEAEVLLDKFQRGVDS